MSESALVSILVVTYDHADERVRLLEMGANTGFAAALCLVRREDPREVRGTLGGLGLPGGPPPPLTPVARRGARR